MINAALKHCLRLFRSAATCAAVQPTRSVLIEGIRMPHFKSGDLVVLKSGGPAMTVDTVNTDIFDDNKITGIVCVWFSGS